MTYSKYIRKFKRKYFSFTNELYSKQGLKNLKKNTELFSTLTDYRKISNSTGCSFSDLWVLYNHTKKYKPKEILECGTGLSTIVMAQALMENAKQGYRQGRITSMEDQEKWYRHAKSIIPSQLKPYIDLIHSEKVEYCYAIFRGVGYKNVPERPYEFVFIDGPAIAAPSDGMTAFDFDYINLVKKSSNPVFGIIDKRIGTSYVYQKLFGLDKVKYDPKRDLCFVGPCTKKDLKIRVGTASFIHSLRIYRKAKLKLTMLH
jgi:hypothetical protein